MILKLQFEIYLEIGHDLSYCDKIFLLTKSETNYLWSPTFRLALTVASRNGYCGCKYHRYTIYVSCHRSPFLRRYLTVLVA